MVFMRSSVIDMEAKMASILPEVSAGMMPSQAIGVQTQVSPIAAQTALPSSISKPVRLPLAS